MTVYVALFLAGMWLGNLIGSQRNQEREEEAYKAGQLYGAQYIQQELEAGRLIEVQSQRARREPAQITLKTKNQEDII